MKDDKVFIKHILDEIDYMIKETKGLEFKRLMENERLQKALIRSLEVVGEATKNISDDFRKKHSDIKWKEIAGLRDKLIHFYFGVDWNTVWNVITVKIPELEKQLKHFI